MRFPCGARWQPPLLRYMPKIYSTLFRIDVSAAAAAMLKNTGKGWNTRKRVAIPQRCHIVSAVCAPFFDVSVLIAYRMYMRNLFFTSRGVQRYEKVCVRPLSVARYTFARNFQGRVVTLTSTDPHPCLQQQPAQSGCSPFLKRIQVIVTDIARRYATF